jgi:hypothetical protein
MPPLSEFERDDGGGLGSVTKKKRSSTFRGRENGPPPPWQIPGYATEW